jgi:hypothetical protein
MKQAILKLVQSIKEDLKDMEDDGVTHSLIDNIWESLLEIEDEIYDDDSNMNDGLDVSDYLD